MSAANTDFGLEVSKGVLAKITMAGVGFLGSIIFARVLGPTGYGTFYVIVTLVNVLNNGVTGWGVACKKRLTEGRDIHASLGAALIGSFVSIVVFVPAAVAVLSVTRAYDIGGLYLPFAVLLASVSLFATTNRVLSGRRNFSDAEWTDTLRSVFTTPAQLLLVLLGLGAAGMAYGLAAATLLTVPFVVWRIGALPVIPSCEMLSNVWAYAKHSIVNDLLGSTQSRVDILLLGALATSGIVGQYQIGLTLTMPALFASDAAASGLMARVSGRLSRGESAIKDVNNTLSYASVLSIPIFFGVLAIPNRLVVTIFGPQYAAAIPLLVGLALYRMIQTQSQQLASIINGLDLPDVNTRISAVSLVTNVVVGYLFWTWVGPVGIVASSIIAETGRWLASVYAVTRSMDGVTPVPRPVIEQIVAGVIMFCAVSVLSESFSLSSWLSVMLVVCVGAVTYGVVLVVVSRHFRTTALGILADVSWRSL
ncbi:lipopolysaccharide biosynthesis protein [Halarchaeum salinum]|uniref:Polysaccharide biosynthesis protein n=1 Tax=Halarchaeum salinum TaxID=489912 RepID=A0AAV3S782_9EURY